MPASPTWKGYSALFEAADSGQYQLAETITYTQIRYGLYSDCVAALVYKGTVGTGGLSTYLVKSCTVTKSRGNVGKMVTVWEQASYGGGAVLPADEFSLTPQDLNPSVEVNPGFANAVANSTVLKLVRAAGLIADEAASNAAWATLLANAGVSTAWDEGLVLADLLRRAVQNYYQASFTYTYTQYFATLPAVDAGGYVGAPGGTLSATISGLGLSCLRQADDLQFSSGVYRRTQSWICAANGSWEAVLYP